jgi:hypothetical protein
VDVVIINPTCPHMVLHASSTIAHAMTVVAQEKTCSYVKCELGNYFIPLAKKTYGCLHIHFVSFFTNCLQPTIACHQQSSLVPMMFISYYQQHVSIAPSNMHMPLQFSSVLSCLGNIPHLFHTLQLMHLHH